MRAFGVVVVAPSAYFLAGVAQRAEPVQVQAFVPELAVEALDEGVLNGLARFDEARAPGGGGLVRKRTALFSVQRGKSDRFNSTMQSDAITSSPAAWRTVSTTPA